MYKLMFAGAVAAAFGLSGAESAHAQYGFHFAGPGVHVDVGRPHGGRNGVLYNSRNHGHHGGHYGHYRGGHYDWHNTSHWDYHPGYVYRHGYHYHYVPGHYDYHRTGHYDYHHGRHGW